MELNELWKAALGEIELQVSKANFKTWLRNTSIVEKRGNVVVIGVPNSFTKEWLENKYHKFILGSLRNLESGIKEVSYQIRQSSGNEDVKNRSVNREEEEKIFGKQLDFQELTTDA